MALIKCPDCGNDCSDSAETCPKCGHPFNTALDSNYETRVIRVHLYSKKQEKLDKKIRKCVSPDWEVVSVVDDAMGYVLDLGVGRTYKVTIRRKKTDN